MFSNNRCLSRSRRRHPLSRKAPARRPRLAVELLESRELLTTGLGVMPGLTDTPANLLVTGIYDDFLHRIPLTSEVAAWVHALNAGLVSSPQVAAHFTASVEYQSNLVEDDYWKFLHRGTGAGEEAGWVQAMQAGLPEDQVAALLLASGEYYQAHGGSPAAWLQGLYQDVLGRVATPADQSTWSPYLPAGAGAPQRQFVALHVVDSAEGWAPVVTNAYQQLLGRTPDSAGLNAWLAVMQQGMLPSQVMATLAGTAEYAADQVAVPPHSLGLNAPFHFDFGSFNSPVAPGYTGVPLVNYDPARGYGWAGFGGLRWENRLITDALARDFHTAPDATFLLDLANGSYNVTVYLADAEAPHAGQALWLNGQQVASGVGTTPGQVWQQTFPVQVSGGQLSLRLAVPAGGSTFDLAGLDVLPGGIVNPTVTIGGVPASGHSPEGSALTLTSTVSDPNPGAAAAGYTYAWAVTKDGRAFASGSGANLTFTPDDNGTYVATVAVTDKYTAQGFTSATITVDNVPPAPNAHGPYSGMAGTAIAFTGSATDPSPVDTAAGFTWAWDFGDGGTSALQSPAHAYAAAGTYTVTLTVTDKDGGTGTARTTAAVSSAGLQNPTVTIGGVPASGHSPEGTALTLTSTVTDPNPGAPAAGYTYAWAVTKNGAAFASGTGAGLSFTPDTAATYVAGLTVTDKYGLSGTASATIAVDPMLMSHGIQTDANGKLAPWYNPDPGVSYDHVLGLVWNYWKNIPPDDQGRPAYYSFRALASASVGPMQGIGGDQFAMAIDSWLHYYAYTGDPAVLQNAKDLANYYLANSLAPADYVYGNLPYPCNTGGGGPLVYDGDLLAGPGVLQPDKAGSFGAALVSLYQVTGISSYLQAAVRIADTLAATVNYSPGPDASPWPFRVDARTGREPSASGVFTAYTTNYGPTLALFQDLVALNQGRVADYNKAFAFVLGWMKTPLANNRWGPFFEDIPVYSDTETNADTWAYYLLQNPSWDANWRQDVRGILDWVQSAAGFADPTWGNINWAAYGVTPIDEQTAYPFPGNSHTARHASTELTYDALTGDSANAAGAVRQLNWSTYMVGADGANVYPGDAIWLTDGYGDYVRHYLRALAADPALAPANQDHLLGTTSYVTTIQYQPRAVAYATADADAQDVLRVTFAPTAVTAGGVALRRLGSVADLQGQEGYTFNAPGDAPGVLRIHHRQSGSISITA